MMVRFLGTVEKRMGGCPVCGRRRSGTAFVTHKTFFLPSGAEKTFRVGRAVEVSDTDGEFLLSFEYGGKPVFEAV